MEEFLDQIEVALTENQFYLALFCCLALPDICGAISSADGMATGDRYKEWFNRYVSPRYDGILDGSNCYAFRCAALHQGRAEHRALGYSRILFIDPDSAHGAILHNNILNDALNIDVRVFCTDIIQGVKTWITENSGNVDFQRNYKTFLRRYAGGLEPYITGADVFC